MVDMWSKEKRSDMMSRIRSHGNKTTELRLITIFRADGIKGWRRRQRLPGSPDFTFRRERLVIFVDGCFWHGCKKCYRRPSTNQDFWDNKYVCNRRRDKNVAMELRGMGWKVIRIWEHDLKFPARVSYRIQCAIRESRENVHD